MFNKSLPMMLLLAGALSVQTATSAEKANSGTGDDVRPASAAPASKTATQSELGGVFSYECDDACLIPERESRRGNTPWCHPWVSRPCK